ncbi:histidine phosphatase family protein [Luteimicrobium subarcticum]|uniref:Broad specificity phosphatase PhoE n=1 Tax=Luteimicrobium subarcticum TaxID=620910 RepID=A0A2M8WVR2_9MICO|nr:histidine phosphatase family protein [Luteimicrobium subarcticum]PJI95019.1 broad specificity phosphatase PhoE [Luteimicrobium subarcticum]
MPQLTTVHLVRHGEVHNPEGVLYGRAPGYRLSELGRTMADRIGEHFADPVRDVAVVVASPLQRAQETATPLAQRLGLEIRTDDRLIEAANHFEGLTFGVGDGSLRHVRHWPYLWNPFRPSWGEPYREQASRVRAAVDTAREAARGHEAVLVSHQLPIWITRLSAEHRRLWHDPRKRQCSLASVTSLRFDGDRLVGVDYSEPAGDLLPGASTVPGA